MISIQFSRGAVGLLGVADGLDGLVVAREELAPSLGPLVDEGFVVRDRVLALASDMRVPPGPEETDKELTRWELSGGIEIDEYVVGSRDDLEDLTEEQMIRCFRNGITLAFELAKHLHEIDVSCRFTISSGPFGSVQLVFHQLRRTGGTDRRQFQGDRYAAIVDFVPDPWKELVHPRVTQPKRV